MQIQNAVSNRDRVGRGLEVLRAGLEPSVERELRARLGGRWQDAVERGSRYELRRSNGSIEWDTPALLGAMIGQWDDVFRYTLGPPSAHWCTRSVRSETTGPTFLYVDAKRYWYSTQASVTRLAQDRAEGYEEDEVHAEIVRHLREEVRQGGSRARGDFAAIHVAPDGSSEIPDEREARLVIRGPEHAHTGRDKNSPALRVTQGMLEARGSSPRIYRNPLVFLAADSRRLKEFDERVRQLLAWSSIEQDADALNLIRLASRQAATKRKKADTAVVAQIGETWSWCLVPEQPDPMGEVEWAEIRTTGGDAPALKASRKLVSEELLLPVLPG